MSALSRPRNTLLDSETATRIVENERRIYADEIDGQQREKGVLLGGQPWNNVILLCANIIMAGLFFYVTSLNASSVLPDSVAWAQPLVGGVCAIGAGCLMYSTNAIAYKLPTIKDRATQLMMWPSWIAMLIVSAVTSAFLALLLVNGADSKIDTARMSMEQAATVAGVETAAVATATAQLGKWSDNAATARTDRSTATARLEKAQLAYAAWRETTMQNWGQGSAEANRRLRDPAHYEHAPHLATIEDAKADLATAKASIRSADGHVNEWEGKLVTAEAAQREALRRSDRTTVSEQSPWEETMADMASMLGFIGLDLTGGQFKAGFAVFFSLVLTLAPPFWSYQTGSSMAPEVEDQADRMAQIEEQAGEMRAGWRGGGKRTPAASGAPMTAHAEASDPDARPLAASESATMGNIVDLAMGLGGGNETLPCGLSQARFEKIYALNYDKVLKLLQDAEGKLLAQTGVSALKKRYGGNDDVANMLKHVLFLEGHGEYGTGGSISLFNPAEGRA